MSESRAYTVNAAGTVLRVHDDGREEVLRGEDLREEMREFAAEAGLVADAEGRFVLLDSEAGREIERERVARQHALRPEPQRPADRPRVASFDIKRNPDGSHTVQVKRDEEPSP